MIKYFLDEEAYMFLNEWSELFRTQTKWCPYYDRESEVYLMGEGYDSLIGYFTAKSYGYKFNIVLKENFPEIRKGQIAKGKITHKENSESDFDLIFDIRDKDDEKLKDVEIKLLQVFCTAFVEANCFMWYGNYVENKKYIAKGQKTFLRVGLMLVDAIYTQTVEHVEGTHPLRVTFSEVVVDCHYMHTIA